MAERAAVVAERAAAAAAEKAAAAAEKAAAAALDEEIQDAMDDLLASQNTAVYKFRENLRQDFVHFHERRDEFDPEMYKHLCQKIDEFEQERYSEIDDLCENYSPLFPQSFCQTQQDAINEFCVEQKGKFCKLYNREAQKKPVVVIDLTIDEQPIVEAKAKANAKA